MTQQCNCASYVRMLQSLLYFIGGKDYISLSLNITSTGGIRCFNVTIIDDTIFESQSGEAFTVQLQIISPLVLSVATADVTIQDNDGKF